MTSKGNKFRLMKIFEIESSYLKHKQRLLSIQNLDAKRKVSLSTNKNIQVINSFKRTKLTADIFIQKEKGLKINLQNNFIHKNLTKVYTRQPNKTMKHINSKSSLRSVSSHNSRIKEENSKMKDKIAATKSTYQRFRATNSKRKESTTSKDQLVRLLQGQLGVKSKVVFPHVKRRQKSIKSSSMRDNQLERRSISIWKD